MGVGDMVDLHRNPCRKPKNLLYFHTLSSYKLFQFPFPTELYFTVILCITSTTFESDQSLLYCCHKWLCYRIVTTTIEY